MVKEIQYTNIRRVLDAITEHPMLRDVTLEQVVRHTVRFIGLNGFPKLYQDKIEDVDIKDYRGLLPCDLISIIQVKDLKTMLCMRSMTDNFTPGLIEPKKDKCPKMNPEGELTRPGYISPMHPYHGEPAFKTQGRVIYTSFPEGKVQVAYKAIPVDEDGFPLLVDNENYLAALEAYIKKQVFTVKFDQNKISAQVLQNAQQDYAFLAAELQSEFSLPSQSEMESISRMMTSLIPRMREFSNGFKTLGNREFLKKH